MAARTPLTVMAPVALLDYANPRNKLLASLGIPTRRREDGIEILHPRWLYPPKGGWLNGFLLFLRIVWPIRDAKKRQGCNVLDAHYAHPEGVAAALVGMTLAIPVVVTMRGSELRYQQQRMKRFWIRWALRRAACVIAVSEGLRQLALDLGVPRERTAVIPNGINAEVFYLRDRRACRQMHSLANDDLVILCAGDLAELKGHHKVIRALKALADTGITATLIIAGGVGRSGRYASAIRQQVTACGLDDRVRFTGEVKQHALAELMSAANVFCLASSSEGWPNVVNEALACGTPVVATDVGAVRQMIVSDEYGLVVPVNDIAALTDALRSALSREWNRTGIAGWGRSRSWDDVATEVLAQMSAAVRKSSCRSVE